MAPDRPRLWTLMDVVAWTAEHFRKNGIDAPRLTAEILMGFCLDLDRVGLYMAFDRPLNRTERERYKALIRRRLQGEPVAYITGTRGFWDIELSVSPHVLIPRPDTETLVEAALAVMDNAVDREVDEPLHILELGSGSGAVVLSLAVARPAHRYLAVDLSFDAARTTRDNARRCKCEDAVDVVTASWFSAISPGTAFDLIVSNPPYIPTGEIDALAPEIRFYEPRMALDGGDDGLFAIRDIIRDAFAYLVPGGALLLETGFDQKDAVADLVGAFPGYHGFKSIRDAAGHHRVVCVYKKE